MEIELLDTPATGLALMVPRDLALDPGSPEFREHVEAGAVQLARVFSEATANMKRLWTEFRSECSTLEEAMKPATAGPFACRHFDVGLYYDGSRHSDYRGDEGIDRILKRMNVIVWELLIGRMGIKNIMSIRQREEFEKQINQGDVPAVTAENIIGVIMGLADRAAEFATEAAKETLTILTPASGRYKTNSGFKVGRRVILSHFVERRWDGRGFRPNYYREKELISLDGTFRILDEKGPIRDDKDPLGAAIETATGGRGETDYFRFRCFKNGNLHVEFKRLDLVKKLNGLATGEYVLGQDID